MKCFLVTVECTNSSRDTCNMLPSDFGSSKYIDVKNGKIYVFANHLSEVAREFDYCAISIEEVGFGYVVPEPQKSKVCEPKKFGEKYDFDCNSTRPKEENIKSRL